MRVALSALLSSLDRYEQKIPTEVRALRKYSRKLLNTLDAFKLKAAYSENRNMLLDVTDSGFPNYLEFKKLEDDLMNSEKYLAPFPGASELKSMILEHIFSHQSLPESLIQKLSYVSYLEDLRSDKLFREFNLGDMVYLKSYGITKKINRYVYDWAAFDSVNNRPFIYVMVFDISDKGSEDQLKEKLGKLEVQLRKFTHNTSPLKVIASDIDEHFEYIYPKILKRIDLGPVHSQLSQDEKSLTRVIKAQEDPFDFILTYTTEVVFSVGQKKKGLFSLGEIRQIFYVDESNKECMERMVSQVQNYLITSHEVLQDLNENHESELKKLSALPYVFPKDQLWKEASHPS